MGKMFVFVFGCLMAAYTGVFADMQCDYKMDDDCEMHGKLRKNCSLNQKDMKMHEGVLNINKYLRVRKQLDITAQQKTELEQIRDDFKKNSAQKKDGLKTAHEELMDAMMKDTPNFAAAREKAKQISDLQAQMKLLMLDASEKGYNVLTDDQKKKLKDIKEEHKERKTKKMKEMME